MKMKTKVAVAGFWELGWNTPIKEIELWEYPLRDFGVDDFYMIPVSGIDSKFVKERTSLEEIFKENQSLVPVFVDENAGTDLAEFTHPKNALYVLGKTTHSPYLSQNSQGLGVKIETKADKTNSGMLWAHQAISIVLYDRLKKSWQ